MGRIAISMSDDLLRKVKRKFGSDVDGTVLEKHLEASLIEARMSSFTVADEQFWQGHIDRVTNSKPAGRKRSTR